jgi:rhodanese-related sulfurtransferase
MFIAKDNKDTFEILKTLDVIKKGEKLNFNESKELLIFCNGAWCKQSVIAIQSLIKLGYPEEKLYWYRGGLQAWQSLGLTVIKP